MSKSPKASQNKGAKSNRSPTTQLEVIPDSPVPTTSIVIGNISPKEGDVIITKSASKVRKAIKESLNAKVAASPK